MEGFASDKKATVLVILFEKAFCRLLLLNFAHALVGGVVVNRISFAESWSFATGVYG